MRKRYIIKYFLSAAGQLVDFKQMLVEENHRRGFKTLVVLGLDKPNKARISPYKRSFSGKSVNTSDPEQVKLISGKSRSKFFHEAFMGANLQQIARYLDNLGWDYRFDEEAERIITGVEADHLEDFLIVVQLDEDGRFFRLFAPQVLTGVADHPYKADILQTMLAISWETKMLQWEYDTSDGEIRAIIEFPLEDSALTEKQFNRCLSALIQIVDSIAIPRLQEVMVTGIDPGNIELGERLLLSIQEQAPGMLELLEKAMEARKKRGSFPSEEADI